MLNKCLFLMLAGLVPANADFIVTFLDNSESVQNDFGGGSLSPCTVEFGNEICGVDTDGFSPITSDVNMFVNIFDRDGVTLSDTLSIVGVRGTSKLDAEFRSDVEGMPIIPLAGGIAMIEDGSVQTAATVTDAGFNYIYRVQSDVDVVPEPSPFLPLGILLLGTVLLRRCIRRGPLPVSRAGCGKGDSARVPPVPGNDTLAAS